MSSNLLRKALWRFDLSTVGTLLAILSFFLYSWMVFSLPQQRSQGFLSERGSLAVAVSHWIYGAPFGKHYSGVLDRLYANLDKPLTEVIDGLGPEQKLGSLQDSSYDGNGIGYALIAVMAFGLFGVHAQSLLLLTVGVMAVTATMLLWRFGPKIAGVVVVYFCTLSVMLFTIIGWFPPFLAAIPVGGIRYFSLVAVLPAIHLFFELMEPRTNEARCGPVTYLLMGAQLLVLLLVVAVRTSAGSLIVAITLVLLWRLWQSRKNRAQLQAVISRALVMTLGGASLAGAIMLWAPDAIRNGQFTSVFWHRAVISLDQSMYPKSGIALSLIYDCNRFFPNGAAGDQIGICLWMDYGKKHAVSDNELGAGMYGRRYENVMRREFFEIVRRFPAEVLTTIFFYKAESIFRSISDNLRADLSFYPTLSVVLLIAQLIGMFLYFSFCAPTESNPLAAAAAVIFAVFTMLPYLVAWAFPYTTADLLLYCIFLAGLLLGEVLARARGATNWAVQKWRHTDMGLPPAT